MGIFFTPPPSPPSPLGNVFDKDPNGNIVQDPSPFDADITDSAIDNNPQSQPATTPPTTTPPTNKSFQGQFVGDAYNSIVEGEYRIPVYDANGKEVVSPENAKDTVPALINGFAVIRHAACGSISQSGDASKWRDISGNPGAFPKYTTKGSSIDSSNSGTGGRYPTLSSLLADFNTNSLDDDKYPTPYYVSDFMYSKYFDYIPLNRLITLRRFPHPTWDSLKFPRDKDIANFPNSAPGNVRSFKPIAQAITYFGDPTGNKLEDLTKIKGLINWKQLEAEVNIYKGEMVAGLDAVPFGGKLGNFGKAAAIISGKSDVSGKSQEEREYAAAYTQEDYTRKPYGPINSIVKTNIRDRGIEGNLKFSLVFEYELRSYTGINPRLAFMDVFCNMLALVFHNAKFWGGANRYYPNHPQYAFLGDQKKFFEGDYAGYLESFTQEVGASVMSGLDTLKNIMGAFLNMDFMGAIKQLAKTVGGTILDMQSAKGRPHMIGFKALLNGDPTGEWHVTVGNPYRPMMMVGNLIMKDFEYSMSGHLGVDDIPTSMKWIVNLEQGMPRDKAGLESVFNYGQGKMYYKPVLPSDQWNQTQSSGVGVGTVQAAAIGSAVSSITGIPPSPQSQQKLSRLRPLDQDFIDKLAGVLY